MKGEDYKLIKENWDKFLNEEDIPGPPSAPGGLEEVTQFLPGGMSTLINVGTKTPEVVQRALANALETGAIPPWIKPYVIKAEQGLKEMGNTSSWKFLIFALKAASWLSDPLGQKIWQAKLDPVLQKFLDDEFPEQEESLRSSRAQKKAVEAEEALKRIQDILKQPAIKENEEK